MVSGKLRVIGLTSAAALALGGASIAIASGPTKDTGNGNGKWKTMNATFDSLRYDGTAQAQKSLKQWDKTVNRNSEVPQSEALEYILQMGI